MLCHRWHGLIKYGIAKTKIKYKIENSDHNASKYELLFAAASVLHQTHTFRYQWWIFFSRLIGLTSIEFKVKIMAQQRLKPRSSLLPSNGTAGKLMFLVTVEILSSGIHRSMSGRVGTTKTLHVHSQNYCVSRLYDVRYRFGLSFQCNLSHPRRQYAAIIIHSTVSNQFNDFKKYVCRVHWILIMRTIKTRIINKKLKNMWEPFEPLPICV